MDRPMSAFMLSATLHGVVIAILLLLGYAASQQVQTAPRILELVAGGGDNLYARQAPKRGTPTGVKLDIPASPIPEVKEAPPEPSRAELAKSEPAPAPMPAPKKVETVAPTKPPETKAPDFKKQIANRVRLAERRAKAEAAKARKAEQRRLEEEAKKEAAKMTKQEFDRINKAKAVARAAPPKVKKIDVDGIVSGVLDGSEENKTGGQGGSALTSDNDDVMAAWIGMLSQRVKANFELPSGADDSLEVALSFYCSADGKFSNFRVRKSSGNREFDNAVIDAVRRTVMPARPDGKGATIPVSFSTRDLAR